MKKTILFIAVAMVLTSASFAVDINVGPGGAHATITAALAAAGAGDILKVAGGTYAENNMTIGVGVAIEGGYDATFTTRNATTTIDAGDTDRHFNIAAGITGWSLDGLTLANGHGTSASLSDDRGGSINASEAGIVGTINDCIFQNCQTDNDGGAIWMDSDDTSLTITDTLFTGCSSADNAGCIRMAGGGDDNDCTLILDGCVFTGNSATGNGATVRSSSSNGSVFTITNCVFENNTAGEHSVMLLRDQITLQNCTIVGNTVTDTASGIFREETDADDGGQVAPQTGLSFVLIQNNIFANNTSAGGGSPVISWREPAVVRSGPDGVGFGIDISNNLAFNNTGVTAFSDDGQAPALAELNRDGNIEADPKFVSASDYHLADATSAAVDAAATIAGITDDIEGNARPQGGGFDIGAYESAFTGGAEGEGEGEGEPVYEGTPVAGMLGLGLIAAACALGGSMFLRKRE